MALTRPSTALSQKTNVNPSVNRQQEATAEDFNEVGSLLNEYADKIELLSQNGSANPYYGSYTSLAVLQAAHPTALTDGWAIIDAGSGVTPQIAAWDDGDEDWQLTGATEILVLTNSLATLPTTGDSQKIYITLNDYGLYIYNSEYIRLNPSSTGYDKESVILYSGAITQIQFTAPFPKMVELYEDGQYRIENDFYTYNVATGLVSFVDENGQLLAPEANTQIDITKFY